MELQSSKFTYSHSKKVTFALCQPCGHLFVGIYTSLSIVGSNLGYLYIFCTLWPYIPNLLLEYIYYPEKLELNFLYIKKDLYAYVIKHCGISTLICI